MFQEHVFLHDIDEYMISGRGRELGIYCSSLMGLQKSLSSDRSRDSVVEPEPEPENNKWLWFWLRLSKSNSLSFNLNVIKKILFKVQ